MAVLISAKDTTWNAADGWHVCPDSSLTLYDGSTSYITNMNGGTFAWTPGSAYNMLGVWMEVYYNQAASVGSTITVYLQENAGGWTTRASGTYTLTTNDQYGAGIYIEFSSTYAVTAVAATWRLVFAISPAATFYMGNTSASSTTFRYAMVSDATAVPANGDGILITHTMTVDNDYSAANLAWFRLGSNGKITFSPSTTTYLKANTGQNYIMGAGEIIMGQDGAEIPSGYDCTFDCYALQNRGYGAKITAKGTLRWVSYRTKLATSAGSTSCLTDDDTGWLVGEEVLFCPTGDAGAGSASETADFRTLTTVSGTTLGYGAISYGHYAVGDYKCDVANLTRNVKFIRSSGGGCAITQGVGKINTIDLYCCQLYNVGFTSSTDPAYTLSLEEVSIKAYDQNLYIHQTWSSAVTTNYKNCVFCNFRLGYFGGYGWTSDNCIYADGSYTTEPGAYFLFYYHSIFKNSVIAGIYRRIRLYLYGVDDFSNNEFYANSSHTSSPLYTFAMYGYVNLNAVNCKFWKNNYYLFYFDSNTYTGIMTFSNCKFAGNNGNAANYADFYNYLASTYNGMIIFKDGCEFDGWTGRTCTHAFYGSFGNLLIGSGTKFGYNVPYSDRYFRFLIGSKVNMHDIWASNLAIYGDGSPLGVEDYVAIQGANNDPNYIIYYSNYGSRVQMDYDVYYGNSGHSWKITPGVGYKELAFALLRFWIPCTAGEKVTVTFRCRKSAPIFYAGVYNDTVNPTATLRSLDQFSDVVTTMDAADTNWNLVTVAGTPTRTGSLILDIWHADYNGRPINIDAFEVTYG